MPTQNIFTDSLFNPKEFTITYELVPGQGSSGRRLEKLLKFVALASEDGRIKALSITDNPGGHPALAPIAIGSDVKQHGVEPDTEVPFRLPYANGKDPQLNEAIDFLLGEIKSKRAANQSVP